MKRTNKSRHHDELVSIARGLRNPESIALRMALSFLSDSQRREIAKAFREVRVKRGWISRSMRKEVRRAS